MRYLMLFFLAFSIQGLSGQILPDRHNTTKSNGWLSCTESDNPNPARPKGHWIMYDFKTTYALGKSTLWNSNAPDVLDAGIKDYYVDYSLNGTTWSTLGLFTAPQANASGFYMGAEGPNFDDIICQYVLITPISNYGHASCYGFAEWRVASEYSLPNSTVNHELSLNMEAFPNPFDQKIKIVLDQQPSLPTQLEITDVAGKVVWLKSIHDAQTEVDGSLWASGLYIATIKNAHGTKNLKITKI